MIRVAINGFGRIGRNTLKAALGRLKELEFVAINDLTDTKTLAHLLKHDTNYGAYEKEVTYDEKNLYIDGKKTKLKLVNEDYWVGGDKTWSIDIMSDEMGLTVSYTGKHGVNGMCVIVSE